MEMLLKLARPALFAAAATMCSVLGNSAAVADGVRRSAAPVVQQAPTSWSGFYFGAHAGWSWSDFDATFPNGNSFSVSHDAQIVGGQIGVQHQFGFFVLGLEGGLSVAYQDDYASERCPNALFECAARFDDVLTIGPRFGWAMGKWMPYFTGGYANAAFSAKAVNRAANVQPNGALGNVSPLNSHERHSGWYIGGGIDMALAHGWTIGLEYRHYEFSDASYQPAANLLLGGVGLGTPFDADVVLDTVTLRASWKFDRPAPAAAPMK